MRYSQGYKYKLCSPHFVGNLPVEIMRHFQKEHISSSYYAVANGHLSIWEGYAWDGATGIPDTSKLMVPSLVHDVLYQMMRNYQLSTESQGAVDLLFYSMMIERKVPKPLAKLIYAGLKVSNHLGLTPKEQYTVA